MFAGGADRRISGPCTLKTYRVSRESGEVAAWFSPFDFGEKNADGKPARLNTNRRIVAGIRPSCRSVKGYVLDRRTLDQHAEGVRTIYVTARTDAERYCLCIDVDNHDGRGTIADAERYIEAVQYKYGEALYYEASTHGRGVHAYFFLKSTGDQPRDARAIRRWERELDYFRREGVNEGRWQVDRVEIKGTPGRFVRDRFGTIVDYHAGSLIKAPRGFRTRFAELKDTITISAAEILTRPVPVKPAGYDEERTAGSAGSTYFGPEDLDRLKPGGALHNLATKILNGVKIYCGKRLPLQIEDMAVFLMILRRFHKNQNADRTMPTRRWEIMWTALYDCGDVDRRWNRQRFQACRDFLSGKNPTGTRMLDWENTLYIAGTDREDTAGKYRISGTACRWTASGRLIEFIEEATRAEKERKSDRSENNHDATGLSLILGESTDAYRYDDTNKSVVIPFRLDYPRPKLAGFAVADRRTAA